MDTGQSPGYCWGKLLSLPTQEQKQVHAATKKQQWMGSAAVPTLMEQYLEWFCQGKNPYYLRSKSLKKENIVNN